jgi:hypothetical protein
VFSILGGIETLSFVPSAKRILLYEMEIHN